MPSLNWIGRETVERHHTTVPFHILREDPARSHGDAESGNLLVEGDNLLALKALLPYYADQVKCIYIDPPYNTGNEGWTYNDNVNSPIIREWLGRVVGRETEDLSRHDKWLCMMYPRLVLLRQFLREDGVILVSIDDFEVAYLRCVMDEVFGRQNFIAQLVWEKGRKNDARLFSVGHEYMVVYARSMDTLRRLNTVWREPKLGAREIWDKYTELRETHGGDDEAIEAALQDWYKQLPQSHPSKALSRYKHIDRFGPWRDRDISWPGGGGPRYDVPHPVTKLPCKVPERGWGFANPISMQRQIDLGLVVFRQDHTDPPFRKAHLRPIVEELDEHDGGEGDVADEGLAVGLQVMPSVIYKQSQVAVKYLRKLMGGKVFDNPKDFEILARLVRYVTNPGDLILDSFAGSGTTGHAVLQLNKQDSGTRRFILVEMEPDIAGPITAERLRRVICGYADMPGLGGGFRYCTLGPTLFDAGGSIRPEISFDELARFVFFCATGAPMPEPAGRSPLLGVHNGVAVYLLYNGILKDKSPDGGNALTRRRLAELPSYDGPKVIYGTSCRISAERRRRESVTFRHIPLDLRVE